MNDEAPTRLEGAVTIAALAAVYRAALDNPPISMLPDNFRDLPAAVTTLHTATAFAILRLTGGDVDTAKDGVRKNSERQLLQLIEAVAPIRKAIESQLEAPDPEPTLVTAEALVGAGSPVCQPFTLQQGREISRMREAFTRAIRRLAAERAPTVPMVVTALGNAVADVMAHAGGGNVAELETHLVAFRATMDAAIQARLATAIGAVEGNA